MRRSTDGNLINIEDRIPAIASYLAGIPGAIASFVFGSYGTEHQTPLSDVDIAVLFRYGAEPDLERELSFKEEICDIAGEENVDLVVINRAPLPLQHRILSTGRQLFVADEIQLADFIEGVIKRYPDLKIDLDSFYRDYDEAFREAYGRG